MSSNSFPKPQLSLLSAIFVSDMNYFISHAFHCHYNMIIVIQNTTSESAECSYRVTHVSGAYYESASTRTTAASSSAAAVAAAAAAVVAWACMFRCCVCEWPALSQILCGGGEWWMTGCTQRDVIHHRSRRLIQIWWPLAQQPAQPGHPPVILAPSWSLLFAVHQKLSSHTNTYMIIPVKSVDCCVRFFNMKSVHSRELLRFQCYLWIFLIFVLPSNKPHVSKADRTLSMPSSS